MRILLVILLLALMILPSHAYVNDAKDIWPAFFGTESVAPGVAANGYMVFWDQLAAAWQAPRLIANDVYLGTSFIPQRENVCWDTPGTYNVTFIEVTSYDLEIWESPDNGWQDDAGGWAMTDDDNSQDWLEVDVECRQDFVHGAFYYTNNIEGGYIDVNAGGPNWATYTIAAVGQTWYSVVMDNALLPWQKLTYCDNVDSSFSLGYLAYAGVWANDTARVGEYPQLVSDKNNWTWLFYTLSNQLWARSFKTFQYVAAPTVESVGWASVYTATTLTYDYHATWLAYDDTIHVALVDSNLAGNTILVYMRLDGNGWSAPVTLVTVDSTGPAFDLLTWPQITVDRFGAIFIYYIYSDDYTGPAGGDLRGEYLDASLYSGFAVPANWVAHTNIDASSDLVLFVQAPDYIPVNGDM